MDKQLLLAQKIDIGYIQSITVYQAKVAYISAECIACYNQWIRQAKCIPFSNPGQNNFAVSSSIKIKSLMIFAKYNTLYAYSFDADCITTTHEFASNGLITSLSKSNQPFEVIIGFLPNVLIYVDLQSDSCVSKQSISLNSIGSIYGVQHSRTHDVTIVSGNINEEKKILSCLVYVKNEKKISLRSGKFNIYELLLLLRDGKETLQSLCENSQLNQLYESFSDKDLRILSNIELPILQTLYRIASICRYDSQTIKNLKLHLCRKYIFNKINHHQGNTDKIIKWMAIFFSYEKQNIMNFDSTKDYITFDYSECPLCGEKLKTQYIGSLNNLKDLEFPTGRRMECVAGHSVVMVDVSLKTWAYHTTDYYQCIVCSSVVKNGVSCKLCGEPNHIDHSIHS